MKTIATTFNTGLALLLTVLLSSCGSAPSDEAAGADYGPADPGTETLQPGAEIHSEAEIEGEQTEHEGEGGVHLSRQQLAAMDITYGDLQELKVNDYLSATGTLGLPPNAYAAVSARASGFIRNSRNYVEGDFVQRGAVIAYLENPDFIEHQRQYLESLAELTYLQQDLERQETLLAENAGILKAVQQLRSQVAAKVANVSGLRQRLEYLGIRTAELRPDNIVEQITLFAPRSGYITTISLHDGMYVEPSTQLMELIDENHLHLELDVFERDIARVEKGQRVTYQIPSLGERRYTAEVHVIGKEFNTENKTVRVHAHLTGEHPPFIRDLFAEARIWLSDQTTPALPEEAIFREGETAYVFAGPEDQQGDEISFHRLRVNPGATDDGYTAVRLIDSLPAGMRIVTQGAYFVYAQSQSGELEHGH